MSTGVIVGAGRRCAVAGVTGLAVLTASVGISDSAEAATAQHALVVPHAQQADARNASIASAPVAVRGPGGRVVGWTISSQDRAALVALRTQLLALDPQAPSVAEASIWDVARCVAAVAAFIALTVFPTLRAARLAVRIAALVKKYGVTKVAKILLRLQRGGEYDAIFKEIAKEAAGVGALGVCFS